MKRLEPKEADLRAKADGGDLRALFAVVEILDGRGEFAEAAALLGEAARGGSLDAIGELGARTALGAGVPANHASAIALLEFAAGQGHPPAARWLARLAVIGAETADSSRVIAWLSRDARAGDAASLQDLAQLAGERGPPRAADIDAYCAAADPAGWSAPLNMEWISDDPAIGRCKDLLHPAVCEQIILDARPALERAGVTTSSTGAFSVDAARTNSSAQVAFFAQPIALALAKRRIAQTVNASGLHLERTNVLCYRPGEAFAPHWDYLDPAASGFARELADQGQRTATCLIGLSDSYTGGETDFPTLGLRLRLTAGDALLFSNVDRVGRPDARTLHAGLPPATGEKWVVSQWVRSRPNRL
jgi:prolyl 4-hydroxylase